MSGKKGEVLANGGGRRITSYFSSKEATTTTATPSQKKEKQKTAKKRKPVCNDNGNNLASFFPPKKKQATASDQSNGLDSKPPAVTPLPKEAKKKEPPPTATPLFSPSLPKEAKKKDPPPTATPLFSPSKPAKQLLLKTDGTTVKDLKSLPGKSGVFRATKKHQQKMQPLKEALMEYEWKSESDRKRHFNWLKTTYDDGPGGDGLWINNTPTYRMPSVEAIYTLPEWSELKNLASIPRTKLPQFFRTEEEIVAKRGVYHADIYQNTKHSMCSKCNKPSAIESHFTRRCVCCYMMDCERILFAFSPESEHSGMMDDPHGAVDFIKKSLHSGWDATTMAKCIDADHKTDDTDENAKVNRKTGEVGKFFFRERRMKEIENGAISFMLKNNHYVKTHVEGDTVRKGTRKDAELRESREAETEKHLKNLDVSHLMEFTDHIHSEGLQWPLEQFLTTVLPWWEAKAAQVPLEHPPVTVDNKYMLELRSRLYSV